jgi:hypothetical protein
MYITISLVRRSFRSKERPSYVDTTSMCLSVCLSPTISSRTVGRIVMKFGILCGKYEFGECCLRNIHISLKGVNEILPLLYISNSKQPVVDTY